MPSLSISFSPRLRPLIQLAILPAHAGDVPSPAASTSIFTALVDTGASCTSLSKRVVTSLNLLPVGKQPVGGVHGMQPTNLYQFVVALTFPHGPPPTPARPRVLLFPISGAEFIPGQAPFDVLLGRDVLCDGVLTMAFDGRMTFSV